MRIMYHRHGVALVLSVRDCITLSPAYSPLCTPRPNAGRWLQAAARWLWSGALADQSFGGFGGRVDLENSFVQGDTARFIHI